MPIAYFHFGNFNDRFHSLGNDMKKNIYSWFILFIAMFCTLLVGCKTLKVEPNEKVKQCLNQCTVDYQYCQKICFNNCSHCCGNTKAHAAEQYSRYLNQMKVQGQPAIHWLQYYDDQLKCNKNSCNCQAEQLLCKQHCTGKYIRRLKVYNYC